LSSIFVRDFVLKLIFANVLVLAAIYSKHHARKRHGMAAGELEAAVSSFLSCIPRK